MEDMEPRGAQQLPVQQKVELLCSSIRGTGMALTMATRKVRHIAFARFLSNCARLHHDTAEMLLKQLPDSFREGPQVGKVDPSMSPTQDNDLDICAHCMTLIRRQATAVEEVLEMIPSGSNPSLTHALHAGQENLEWQITVLQTLTHTLKPQPTR